MSIFICFLTKLRRKYSSIVPFAAAVWMAFQFFGRVIRNEFSKATAIYWNCPPYHTLQNIWRNCAWRLLSLKWRRTQWKTYLDLHMRQFTSSPDTQCRKRISDGERTPGGLIGHKSSAPSSFSGILWYPIKQTFRHSLSSPHQTIGALVIRRQRRSGNDKLMHWVLPIADDIVLSVECSSLHYDGSVKNPDGLIWQFILLPAIHPWPYTTLQKTFCNGLNRDAESYCFPP